MLLLYKINLVVLFQLNCSLPSPQKFKVIAEDFGDPSKSAQADVVVNIVDSEAQPPFFDKTLYEATIPEDISVGTCFLKVSITY